MSQTTRYEITPDTLQWALRKFYTSEKGTPVETIVGWFPKLHLALQAQYEGMLRDSLLSIPGDREAIENSVNRAESIFRGIG